MKAPSFMTGVPNFARLTYKGFWLLLAALLLAPSLAQAIGLSNIRVQSKLNQRFKAEIELISTDPISAESVHASLAPAADFARAGYERPFLLSQLRFKPVTLSDGRTLIRISSKETIKESYLSFLVEIAQQQGRIVRAYSVMLEPPVRAAKTKRLQNKRIAKQVKPAKNQKTARQASVSSESVVNNATPLKRKVRSPIPAANTFPVQYGPVGAGETLWSIASATRVRGSSVEQMLMAFYRNNPDAFPSAHISDLKAGKTLLIPSKDELFRLNRDQARLAFQDQENR